jgi:hypothetical protein
VVACGREIAALLCRRYTSATLAELSERFGLHHPDSSANLVRRAKKRAGQSAAYRRQIALAESKLATKTENQVPGDARKPRMMAGRPPTGRTVRYEWGAARPDSSG